MRFSFFHFTKDLRQSFSPLACLAQWANTEGRLPPFISHPHNIRRKTRSLITIIFFKRSRKLYYHFVKICENQKRKNACIKFFKFQISKDKFKNLKKKVGIFVLSDHYSNVPWNSWRRWFKIKGYIDEQVVM